MQDFTVIDLAQHLKIETSNEAMWELGALVRDRWFSECGKLPNKDLRKKKNGAGSHCYAVYPESFWKTAKEIGKRYGGIRKMQIELGL